MYWLIIPPGTPALHLSNNHNWNHPEMNYHTIRVEVNIRQNLAYSNKVWRKAGLPINKEDCADTTPKSLSNTIFQFL